MTTAPDVVHVVCTNAFAGVERYVTTLARAQAARGLQVQVLGGAAGRMPAELAGTSVRWAPAVTVAAAARALLGLRPGVVHAHMTAAELAAVATARAPVVATRHFAERRGSSPVARTLGRVLTRRIAAQVAISSFVATRVEGASTVVHPGVPDADVTGAERQPVVLMAQRLEPEKRADTGLRIWAASGLGDRGWQLLVAGTGACRHDLERLAAELGVASSCRFLGSRSDVSDLLASAAVFLAPRPDEPYGLSVVEAMAHATPIVAAGGGGHDETVGSVPGAVLVPAHDPVSAGASLADLAADPARCRSYGRALQDVQRARFGVGTHAAGVAAVYTEVLR
ncbi:glycosyltransferase family 4 protein [Cellulomonas hominis]|uniref:glycosyltransferase family 4 protein n=1 Tax=Cellulomonas hominis TaxID=156981 RepID=UPI001443BABA|nr:glycosyltransferase family 4 protein [Cellulomonas hominis]NKY09161.1 glycosyltransferase family 4 protein [Cellulomonas hominis]